MKRKLHLANLIFGIHTKVPLKSICQQVPVSVSIRGVKPQVRDRRLPHVRVTPGTAVGSKLIKVVLNYVDKSVIIVVVVEGNVSGL